MKKNYTIFGILAIFLLLPPIAELILFGHYFLDDYDLEVFILSQLFSLVTAFVFLYEFKGFLRRANNSYVYYKNIQIYTFFIVTLFFGVFLVFFFKNIDNFNALHLFSEAYRNSHFKGSGIYTFGVTSISILIMTYIVISSKNLSRWFFASLFLILITVFILGLRIYLIGLFLFLIARIIENNKLLKIIGILVLIMSFMISFKLFLTVSEKDFLEVLGGVMGRLNYRSLLNYSEFTMPIQEFSCLIPGYDFFSGCNLSQFKEWFVAMSPDVAIYMSYIDLYSGVAIPWPILMYNSFGLFGFMFVTPLIVAFILSIKKIFLTNSIYVRILYILLSVSLFGFLVEDIGFIARLGYPLFVTVITVFILIKFGLITKLISKIKIEL